MKTLKNSGCVGNSKRIFVSTVCIPGIDSLSSRMTLYRAFGLEMIELGGSVTATSGEVRRIKEMGCQFLVHNYFPPPPNPFVLNLASADPEIRKRSKQLVFNVLDLCCKIGSPFYSIHAGFVTDPISFEGNSFVFPSPKAPDETKYAMDRYIKAFSQVDQYAGSLGLRILVENNVCSSGMRGRLLLQTAEEFQMLFQAISSPNVGILLDTGHLRVSAKTLSFDSFDFVDKLETHIGAFHVHDNDGTTDSHVPIEQNSWVLDLIRRNEFRELPIIVEAKFSDAADLRQHVDWLKMELDGE